ncbi:5-oxoprolinase [Thalassiosira pseudonana CCMP1335]|uniref:5-oxoprolinase n=1 Tax=Thalassiosira pseudonana TaxID=35128 RepID=B8BVU8_THAPS|nr:5-oxoprolinase [Thalassiosira pseudonana CCMP1335]EED95002.1 5-oxoprolinase [Thalassiosira pseudonana CCMP1335]
MATVPSNGDGKFHFAIDRGGTFTDVHCTLPSGIEVVSKLLSVDPSNYDDAPTEGIRRILDEHDAKGKKHPRGTPVDTSQIGSIRMGTTVATNALLEREGERMGLVISRGFRDLLQIGDQTRSNIFDLTCTSPEVLYEEVVEVEERVMLSEFYDEGRRVGKRITGVTGEKVIPLITPNEEAVRASLQSLADKGIQSLAIVFLHSYVYPEHETMVGKIAKSMNCFSEISLSHEVMSMVKIVPRGHTACAAAYLTPKITQYLAGFTKGFDSGLLTNVRLDFMKSDGGLTPMNDFGGHQAILSGPAGGVVGYAKTSYRPGTEEGAEKPLPVIGFDMGGTSTDVSRYDGTLEHVFETTTAGVSIQAPQLDIHTVAAGGGSRLFLQNGLFVVGPESAKAHPGPVCYRKNGYLAVTDANVVLGRVIPEFFPNIFGPNEDEPLDLEGARAAFRALAEENHEADGRTVEELAYGFVQVANEAMCRPIRNLTQMRGFDITKHALACFGGAGPQHACAMARALGISKVYIHRYGGILSAYGLSMADAVAEEQEPAKEVYAVSTSSGFDEKQDLSATTREARLGYLSEKAHASLMKQGYPKDSIVVEKYLNMRYDGTDNAIMIRENDNNDGVSLPFARTFVEQYYREFGFELEGRDILIDDFRVRAFVPGQTPTPPADVPSLGAPTPNGWTKAYFENGWENVATYNFDDLKPGHEVKGPAIIFQSISTMVLEIGCTALVTGDGDLDITVEKKNNEETLESGGEDIAEIKEDPVQLSIFAHRFMGIAEQMGRTLARTAISVNIKERLDFSCALFTNDGGLVANAPHIPVHLGAMQSAVRFQVEYWNADGREGIKEGDVFVSNHPQLAGGSHLPDITVITPVFHNGKILFFVASRGHHSDIGGISPGSMPPNSVRIEEEGARIVAFKLVRDGKFQEDGITDILVNQEYGGTRNLKDNLSDLRAQVAANNSGIRLLTQLVQENGLSTVEAYMYFIQSNAEAAVRNMLKEFAAEHGTRAHAVDHMDDGTPIELTIDIDPATGSACFDFEGTGPQVLGNTNAPPAVTYSAVIYSLRSMVGQDIPLNQGCLTPIEFKIPPYSLLNPSDDVGVVGGNVLTSQRVVDVVLKAFKACAASQGCMNNLTFGDEKFGYYETIAGGAGAGPTWNGRSGVHTHCTNTRITDPEILERRYPVLLRQFGLRKESGGDGKYKGGDGVVREIEPLRPLVMSILSERRTLQPYGLEGGEPGKTGKNLLIRKNGIALNIGAKRSCAISRGERLVIESPGGGGYGARED